MTLGEFLFMVPIGVVLVGGTLSALVSMPLFGWELYQAAGQNRQPNIRIPVSLLMLLVVTTVARFLLPFLLSLIDIERKSLAHAFGEVNLILAGSCLFCWLLWAAFTYLIKPLKPHQSN